MFQLKISILNKLKKAIAGKEPILATYQRGNVFSCDGCTASCTGCGGSCDSSCWGQCAHNAT